MTIAGEQAIQVLSCFEALGLRGEDICGRLGLARSGLGAPGTRLSRVLFDSLFLSAAELRGDPLIGLHAGVAKAPADLLFFVGLSQPSIGEALRDWARLSPAADDSISAGVVVRGEAARLWVTNSESTGGEARHLFEYLAGQLTQYLALATGGRCRPTGLCFPHAPAGPIVEYEKALGVAVTFRHAKFEVRLRPSDLAMPIVTANPDIARLMREAAELQLHAAQTRSFRARVEMAVRRRIQDAADHSKEGIAALLATSVSTLQRRLHQEGCSFRDVRDDVRRSVAEDLLVHSDRSISEIAVSLDFADVAAFGKAFRRWTAISPRDFRARER